MRYFPVFLLMFAVFSCNTGNESFDDSSLLLSILDNQTERYRRIVDYSNKIDTTYLVARDGLVVNSLIESSRFILQNDLKSDENFLVDTVPGLKTLDSLKIIETNSEYLTRGELITLQFDALQNAFGRGIPNVYLSSPRIVTAFSIKLVPCCSATATETLSRS